MKENIKEFTDKLVTGLSFYCIRNLPKDTGHNDYLRAHVDVLTEILSSPKNTALLKEELETYFPEKDVPLIIAVDFDGTIVTHAYPEIGEDIGAIPVLKELVEAGHKLILLTMRDKEELLAAVEYVQSKGVALYGINKNPAQHSWTSSAKVYANIYIDDAALGCPIKWDMSISNRPFVDWTKVRELLTRHWKGRCRESSLSDSLVSQCETFNS